MIKAIVCIGANGVMGKNGTMPWGDKPLDGDHFRRLTEGHTVVMGRKTFESMGEKELPKRLNVIMTSNPNRLPPSTCYANSVEMVLEGIKNGSTEGDIWIIGGSEVYKAFLPYIEEFYITTVGEAFEGDTYFPDIHRYYDWRSESLGIERRVVPKPIDYKSMAFSPDGMIPKPNEKDWEEYTLVFRKLTKIRRESF